MKLRTVTHDPKRYRNRFCGPAAISAITGRSAERAAAWIRAFGNRRQVTGTSTWEMDKVLSYFGYEMTPVPRIELRKTLAWWLRNRSAEERQNLYVISYAGHWGVVKGRKFVDNHTMEPVFTSKASKRRGRVRAVYEVTPAPGEKAKKMRALRKDRYPEDIPSAELTLLLNPGLRII